MELKKGKVFVFSAPSGSGKTTIVREIMRRFPQFMFSVSATTRPPRAHEEDGKDYYFLSPEAFRSRIEAGDFLEWEEVYPGRYYGTLKSEVDRIFSLGKWAIFDVDVKGGLNIKKYYQEEAVAFFIKIPSLEALRQRLQARGTDSQEEIDRRMAKAVYELSFAEQFDHIIVNDQLDRAVAEVVEIIDQHI